MKEKILVSLFVLFVLFGKEGVAQTEETLSSDTLKTEVKLSKKAQRKVQRDIEFKAYRELLESGTFYFEASLSHSSDFSSVELNTAYNYLAMKDSVATGSFSYFGRSTSVSMKDNLGSVNFQGKSNDYKLLVNEKKKTLRLSFKVHGLQESYICTINVDSSGYVSLGLSSQYKSYISYTGQLFRLMDKNQEGNIFPSERNDELEEENQ